MVLMCVVYRMSVILTPDLDEYGDGPAVCLTE